MKNPQPFATAGPALAISFLKKQQIKDRIPRYLPKDVVVAHKTGLERGIIHDAGIVFTPKGNFFLESRQDNDNFQHRRRAGRPGHKLTDSPVLPFKMPHVSGKTHREFVPKTA